MKDTNQTSETKEPEIGCYCECCHCKKIFMLLVLLILAFIAGIMTGHCQSSYPSYMHYYTPQIIPAHTKATKLHHKTKAKPAPATMPDAQIGGYIIEVDED